MLEVMLACPFLLPAVQEAIGVEGEPKLNIHDLAQGYENLIKRRRWLR
jgi:hypothetical protein